MRPHDLAPTEILAAGKPHGTRIRYMGGCRCLPCRAVNSRYECGRARLRRLGLGDRLVSTERILAHLARLSRKGIGYKTVAKNAGVSKTNLAKVLNGRRTQVRATTEKKILELGDRSRAGAAIIPAGSTWRKIRELLRGGFTKRELARRLGYRSGIQFNSRRILVRNAERVDRFYCEIMAGG